ncbi:MAG: FxsA family protein [Pseudomonadota bacterium]
MNPLLFALIILIALPITEIYFLIEVGSVIGAIPTIIITIFTAVTGISLIRIQGISTVQKLQMSLQQGLSPAKEILEGVMLMLAAVSLLMPGFLSDSLGFLLLIPPLRRWLASLYIAKQNLSTRHSQNANNASYLEGEYEDLSNKASIEKK